MIFPLLLFYPQLCVSRGTFANQLKLTLRQVEQAYSKRTRNMKATKKKKVVPNGVGVAQARVGIGEAARTLMERRKKWMNSIGPVFEEGLTRLPRGSVFGSLEELVEKEKEGVAEED